MSEIVLASERELMAQIEADPTLSAPDKEKMRRAARGLSAKWLAHMSPPGKLGLPPLLDSRRLEYGIVDQAFEQECVFDRIYVWQIPRTGGDTFEGTMIHRPDISKAKDEDTTPRGILISAGLRALDNLRSNGIDLGHIVNFIRSSPWGMPIGLIDGVEIPMLRVMRDGDLVSSEDLARARREGKVSTIVADDGKGGVEHRLQNSDGSSTAVTMPWMPEDY